MCISFQKNQIQVCKECQKSSFSQVFFHTSLQALKKNVISQQNHNCNTLTLMITFFYNWSIKPKAWLYKRWGGMLSKNPKF